MRDNLRTEADLEKIIRYYDNSVKEGIEEVVQLEEDLKKEFKDILLLQRKY